MINWIENWLKDRKQEVLVDGNVSDWKQVMSEVPQDSVLGSLLYVLGINHLDSNIVCQILQFADDTKLYSKVNRPNNDLQKGVEKLECTHLGHGNPIFNLKNEECRYSYN